MTTTTTMRDGITLKLCGPSVNHGVTEFAHNALQR